MIFVVGPLYESIFGSERVNFIQLWIMFAFSCQVLSFFNHQLILSANSHEGLHTPKIYKMLINYWMDIVMITITPYPS